MTAQATVTSEERPLVTFALFAYNQEKYIREAVEGVFAQTYEPLEIILSDDCSTDRTFEIMREMAADYEGPHTVKVRRNAFNMGTALHVYSAYIESSGMLFVVAAGDDISLPDRVEILTALWEREKRPSGVIHSGRETFNGGHGAVIGRFPAKHNECFDNVLQGYAEGKWLPAAAPTCAYTRDVFECFGPLYGGSIIEDAPLMLRAALVGRFIACDDVLVRQRIHDGNTGIGYTFEKAAAWNRFMQSKIIAFRNMQTDLGHWHGHIDSNLRVQIESAILAVLHSASSLILPENRPPTLIEKVRFTYNMLRAPAVAHNALLRLNYALSFFGCNYHVRLMRALRQKLSEIKGRD